GFGRGGDVVRLHLDRFFGVAQVGDAGHDALLRREASVARLRLRVVVGDLRARDGVLALEAVEHRKVGIDLQRLRVRELIFALQAVDTVERIRTATAERALYRDRRLIGGLRRAL